LVQYIFKKKCPLATDFALQDWQSILKNGFGELQKHTHSYSYVQLLKSSKN